MTSISLRWVLSGVLGPDGLGTGLHFCGLDAGEERTNDEKPETAYNRRRGNNKRQHALGGNVRRRQTGRGEGDNAGGDQTAAKSSALSPISLSLFPAGGGKSAVFVDRDNTLIDDPGYLRDPENVRLLEGVAEALIRLRGAGYPVIVVTNQSGIARGYLSEEELEAIHKRMAGLLRARDAAVDAIYYCPYLNGPDAVVAFHY